MAKVSSKSKNKSSKSKGKSMKWANSLKSKTVLVALIFGFVGAGYFLYQTFAASNTVNYWGTITRTNPTAAYKLTTGAGALDITFSNNTADLVLTVKNSTGKTVGAVQSIGKKDAYLKLTVVPDTYTFTLAPKDSNKFGRNKKGYSLHITYPVDDIESPTAVITKPLNNEELSGTVDFLANSQDDTGVVKVDFYVDGVLLGTDSSSPYGTKWDTTVASNGVHKLAVKAYDARGNVGQAQGEATVNNVVVQKQRFPGDPNPLVTGKAYWGASGAHIEEHESATGKSVALHRSYSPSWPGTTKLVNAIKDDNANNRLPWVSTKTTGWGTFANGSYDAEIDQFLRDIDKAADGNPVWLTIHHEPENDSSSTGQYTSANFRAMQTKFRQRMTIVGTENIAFMPIFQGYSWATTKWDINEFYVKGIWDAIAFDHYSDSANSDLLRKRFYDAVAWIEAKGLPYAIGEYGVRDYGDAAQQASELRDFWQWGFNNKKDALGYSYFDSGQNSPAGTWELDGQRLQVWRDILKNDQRVIRTNDL